MVQPRSAIFIAILVAAAFVGACTGRSATPQSAQTNEAAAPAAKAASSRPARNACDLVAREQLEAIATEKLEMLHNIEEEDKTVCVRFSNGPLKVAVGSV